MAWGLIKSAHIRRRTGLCKHNQIWLCRRTERRGREGTSREGGKISAEKKWNRIRTKSIWQKLCISGNYFAPRRNATLWCWWGVKMSSGGRGLQSEVRDVWSQSLSLSQTVHPLWLARLAPHYLPILASIWGENAALQSHFRGTVITRTPISAGERLPSLPESRFLSLRLLVHSVEDRQRWGILSVFCSEKWKFESERWSGASKGTCNWAALDRLSGNMKQQQLWRRVIASLGLYNALSSL